MKLTLIALMSALPAMAEGAAAEPVQQAPLPVEAPVAEPAPVVEEVVDYSDDLELVAVIAAAIAAYEGETSTDGFVVRSIRKVNKRR